MEKPYLNWLKNSFKARNAEYSFYMEGANLSADDQKCLQLIPLILDNEASPNELKFFEERINQNSQIANYYQLEKALKKALQSKIERIPVPNDLILSIKSKISETA